MEEKELNNKTIELLEYDKIKDILKGYGICEITKGKIDKLEPEMNIRIIENNLKETSEARAILEINSNVPIHSMKGIFDILEKLKMGGILLPSELEVIGDLLKELKRLKRFIN
jgi:DNA mismatch repair protein MutS2